MKWLLAIDFGTSNTAAAHATWDPRRGAANAVSVVPLTHAGNLLPSLVHIGMHGDVHVGQAAVNAATSDIFGLVSAPKRLVSGAGALPPRAVTKEDVIGAVLRAALDRARALHDGANPDFLVLTHPEAWTQEQREVLAQAAERVRIPRRVIKMTSEPRAAVRFYGGPDRVGSTSRDGHHVAVFDFGGGTLDVAVLHQTARGHEVVAARGDNSLGGRNLDARIRGWVEQQLEDHAPAILEALNDTPNSGANRALARDIREAKEVLSDAQSATIGISTPVGEHTLQLTRREFGDLIGPDLDLAIELLNGTLTDAVRKGMRPNSLEAVYLTGGSSRIPAVHSRVQQIAPMATLDDPKTVVARGAVQMLLDALAADSGPIANGRASGGIPRNSGGIPPAGTIHQTSGPLAAAQAAAQAGRPSSPIPRVQQSAYARGMTSPAMQRQAQQMQQMQHMPRPRAGAPAPWRTAPTPPTARPASAAAPRTAQTSQAAARRLSPRAGQRPAAPRPSARTNSNGFGVITALLVVLLLLSIAVVAYLLLTL